MKINLMLIPRPDEDTLDFSFMQQLDLPRVPAVGEKLCIDAGLDRPLILEVAKITTLHKLQNQTTTTNVRCYIGWWSDLVTKPEHFTAIRDHVASYGFVPSRTQLSR